MKSLLHCKVLSTALPRCQCWRTGFSRCCLFTALGRKAYCMTVTSSCRSSTDCQLMQAVVSAGNFPQCQRAILIFGGRDGLAPSSPAKGGGRELYSPQTLD